MCMGVLLSNMEGLGRSRGSLQDGPVLPWCYRPCLHRHTFTYVITYECLSLPLDKKLLEGRDGLQVFLTLVSPAPRTGPGVCRRSVNVYRMSGRMGESVSCIVNAVRKRPMNTDTWIVFYLVMWCTSHTEIYSFNEALGKMSLWLHL